MQTEYLIDKTQIRASKGRRFGLNKVYQTINNTEFYLSNFAYLFAKLIPKNK